MLTADQIRAKGAKGRPVHRIPVLSWNSEEVCIQELDSMQIFEWDTANEARRKDQREVMDRGTTQEHMIALSLVTCEFDDDGHVIPETVARIFDTKKSDLAAIRNFGAAGQEIHQACLMLNRLTVKDSEDARKNLQKILGSAGGAILPTNGDAA